MLATQLDLFGAPPRPPAKIRMEEAEAKSVDVPAQHIPDAATAMEHPEPTAQVKQPAVAPVPQATKPSIHVQLPTKGSNLPVVTGSTHIPPPAAPPIPEAPKDEVTESLLAVETSQSTPDLPAPDESHPAEATDVLTDAENITPTEWPEAVAAASIETLADRQQAEMLAAMEPQPEHTDASITREEAKPLGVPEDEILFRRQYYTMRETVAMLGLSHSVLRYWESEFTQLKPRKNRKGDRYFRPADIKNLQLIHHLLKVRKFTIEGAREYLKNQNKALDTFEMVQRLERIKHFLQELKENAGTP